MKTKRLVGVFVGCAIVLSACGDDASESTDTTVAGATDEMPEESSGEMADDSATEEATSEVVATTAAPEADAPSEDVPQAIISLSPTATEMLYAIGAGDQVLAVDDFSNHPAETAEKLPGLSGFEPNVESIAGLDPDLVVTDGTRPDFLEQLDTLEIAHWEGPAAADFDDVYAQIEQLGATTGHVAEAAELVASMQTDVAAIEGEVPTPDPSLTYYHELDPSLFSATSETFIGAVYAKLGLVNIADAVGDGNPFPQLNAEFVIEQNPDLIFLADTKCCGESAATVAERPGWGGLDAVTDDTVVEMDDDIASRWGPRIVDYLREAADAVIAAAPAEAG